MAATNDTAFADLLGDMQNPKNPLSSKTGTNICKPAFTKML